MLTTLASITSIDDRRTLRAISGTGELESGPVDPRDLVGGADDHTKQLLSRRAAARRSRLVPPLLVAGDLGGLSLSYLLANLCCGESGALGTTRELAFFLISLPGWIVVASLYGLYRRDTERANHATLDELARVFQFVTIGAWLLVVLSGLQGLSSSRIASLVALWLLALGVVPLARAVVRSACRRTSAYHQNTVILGAGDVGQLICRTLVKHPEYGANVVGFVDGAPKMRRADLPEHLSVLGGPERLPEIIEQLQVERVIIASSNESVAELLVLVRQLRSLGVQIDVVPGLFELVGPGASAYALEGLPLVALPRQRLSTGARLLKRGIDIVGAGIALIALSPLMAFIALRIRREDGGPVLFRDTRLGAGMKEFTLLKFRTAAVGPDAAPHRDSTRRSTQVKATGEAAGLHRLDRSDALTGVGRWLRRTRLEKTPRLLNVLRGDISLVGPRPCAPCEAQNLESQHLERFLVPQGLAGLSPATAREGSTYVEALDLDLAYVRDWSLGLDLRLLLRATLQLPRQ